MPRNPSNPLMWVALAGAWFVLTGIGIASGVYTPPPQSPSLLLAAQLAIIAVVFGAALRWWPALRRATGRLDPALLTSLQAWRVLGMSFLFLWAFGVLPAAFALPAGLGDAAIGLAAPFVAARVRGRRVGRAYVAFHLLGLADFVLAFACGNYATMTLMPSGEVFPMLFWPLVIVPAAFVPAFTVAHMMALQAGCRAARDAKNG